VLIGGDEQNAEVEVWKALKSNEISVEKALNQLGQEALQPRLTQRSMFLLQLPTEQEQAAFIESCKDRPLEHEV